MTTPHRPRLLLSPARLVSSLVLLGAVSGIVWAFLAPAERLLVVAEDQGVVLTTESLHRFDAVAIFVGIGLVLGVLSAVAVWGIRKSRGPVAVAALVVGSGLGSGVAALAGMGVARLRFPREDNPSVGSIVAMAPGLSTPMVMVVQPLAAALVYLLLVSLSPHDDLGVGHGDRDEVVTGDESPTVDADGRP
ncbi:DUF2567 domain-containing protein [Rhodococcus spongiicola]|uniref:DUF2567 domain-containing protein n=1 Tax=Rhodococcus spongiicola TaxID=2487352 RepID=A0A3S3CLI4_9NOCA|nr:DUF2567 domain-containing protein [Rhodococcus spongiicola]RVW00412.1 DUF2567 domain-containing protein [Rhodococcus spongiicola]